MKTLFIYFSHTGNGDIVAEKMSEKGAELRKVVPKKPLPKAFFLSVMTGGFLATIGRKTPLVGFDANVEGYDRVVVGSPIWNGRFSCPINKVLSLVDFKDVPVDFVLYAGGGNAPKAIHRIQKEFPQAKTVVLKEPKKYPAELEKLNELFE